MCGSDVCASDVNIPRLVPHLAHCHFACGELLVELNTCERSVIWGGILEKQARTSIVDQCIDSSKL
jgi:hypothetical protein